jgi:hypothetical protein
MLQYVAAAHEIRTACIFDREVAAKPCRGSASRLARIIPLAVIACGAQEVEKIAVAASNFDDAFALSS